MKKIAVDHNAVDKGLKRKINAEGEGEVIQFIARLVAKGYPQVTSRDFSESFSPVMKVKSIWIILTLAIEMKIQQIDITAAYLNKILKKDVYMLQPEGIQQQCKDYLVYYFKRSLYGLKQVGIERKECFDTFLKKLGLLRSRGDPCIYYHPKKTLFLGLCIDYMLIVKTSETMSTFKQKFQAKDLEEANEILYMRIQRQAGGSLTLDQTAYIEEIRKSFEASSAKGASTPLYPSEIVQIK